MTKEEKKPIKEVNLEKVKKVPKKKKLKKDIFFGIAYFKSTFNTTLIYIMLTF